LTNELNLIIFALEVKQKRKGRKMETKELFFEISRLESKIRTLINELFTRANNNELSEIEKNKLLQLCKKHQILFEQKTK